MCLHTCTAVARLTLALAKLSCIFCSHACAPVVLCPNTPPTPTRRNCFLSRRVVDGVYMNSQLAPDDCRRIRSTIWKLAKQTVPVIIIANHIISSHKSSFLYTNIMLILQKLYQYSTCLWLKNLNVTRIESSCCR